MLSDAKRHPLRFHEEFPLTYTCDVKRLHRLPLSGGRRPLYQGPVPTIYRRTSGKGGA